MPAQIIGRMACPFCGFDGAHVKRTEGKLAYLHCPDDGWVAHAKSRHQESMLLAKMRPVGVPEPPATDRPIIVRESVKVAAAPKAAEPPKEEPPRKPASWIDQLMGGGK